MRILGLEDTSLVDWDGKTVSVIFLGGCNLACPFCHNLALARSEPGDPAFPEVPWEAIEEVLTRRPGMRDGACITGGEPMMHPEVFGLCRRVKELGLEVKVDTNGCFPYRLAELIDRGLCDFVALDIKAPLGDRYTLAAGRPVDPVLLRRTIRLLLEGRVGYEFRSTLVPGLIDPGDIETIGESVRGAARFTLQHYVPESAPTQLFRERGTYTRAQAEGMAERLRPFVKEVRLRGKFL